MLENQRLLSGNLSELINKSKEKLDEIEIDNLNEFSQQDLNNNNNNNNNLQIINNKSLDNYNPSISDQIKVGFFTSDRNTQTNNTEILVLKIATQNLDSLCKEINIVKSDLKFAKNSIQNQFDQELYNKSIEIYGLINSKINELKSQQEENLERIRRAYKSKLSNSISYFKKLVQDQKEFYLEEKSKNSKIKNSNTNENLERVKELQRTIAEKDIIINNLKHDLKENIEKLNNNKDKSDNEKLIEELKEEKEKAIESSSKLKSKIKRLEDALAIKEEESEKIISEVTNLQLQLEKEKIHYEQLAKEFNEYKLKQEQEKSKLKKEFDKQKIQLETKFNDKMKETRDQIMNTAKQELKQQQLLQKQQEQALIEQKREQEKQYQLILKQQQEDLEKEKLEKEKELETILNEKKKDQENMLKEQLSLAEALQKEKEKEQTKLSSNPRDTDIILKLKTNEFYLKSEINRLKREIHRNNETWEKKFDILKNSLHAIKDEMYLRQNLQKQSAQLAYASVAYTMNQAASLQQQQQQFPQINESKLSSESNKLTSTTTTTKPVLPSIGSGKLLDRPLSVTISVPSRLSAQIENDETQIIDEDEMNKLKEEFFNDIDFIPAK